MVLPFKGIGYEITSLLSSQGTVPSGRKVPCSDMELNAVECLEAYGQVRGQEKCALFLEDMQECKFNTITKMRFHIMREERFKKIVKREIPFSERWGKPFPYDSYVTGCFAP